MPRFVIPMWSPKPDQVREALRAASIAVEGDRGEEPQWRPRPRLQNREIRAIVEARSSGAAAARVRQAVGQDAAIVAPRVAEGSDSRSGGEGTES